MPEPDPLPPTPPTAPVAPRTRLRWPVASLRAYLVLVILVAVVPLALFAFYLLLAQAEDAHGRVTRNIERTSNSFALLIERDLNSSIDLLSGLAYNEALQQGDIAAFHRLLQRSMVHRPGWRGVYLGTPDGQVLFASDQPFGEPLGRLRDTVALDRLRTTLDPAVSDLVAATGSAELVTNVQVPVIVRGELRFVLGARVAASHWQQLAERASVADGGYVALVDRHARLIAHSQRGNEPGHIAEAAETAEPSLWSWMFGRHAALVVQRPMASNVGWTVRAGLPGGSDAGGHAAVLAMLASAGGASLLLGLALALTVARRVSVPLGQLAGGGADTVAEPVVVREIAALHAALATAARQSEADRSALQHKVDEFEALFRSSPVGLAMSLDAQGLQALINPALASLLGTAPGVFPLQRPVQGGGSRPAMPLARDGRPLAAGEQPLQLATLRGEPVIDDALELRRPDGRLIDLEVHAVPLRDASGLTRGAVAAFVDATARRQLAHQRERLMRMEQQARRDAEEANHGKDVFLAMLGHELRNPLSAIAAAVEVLNRTPGLGEAGSSARRVIERQARQMTQLLNDLQDVARVAAGKLTLSTRRLDLAQLVWRPLDALRLAGRLRHHALTLDLDRAWVDADPVRVEQMLVNLLTNAVKYTPAGGRLWLSVRTEGPDAVIEVRDNGIGITAAALPHVFDLFVQIEGTADRRQGGMGLGLTLVRRLVELHGGSVQASSGGPDAGSTFIVRLPGAAAPFDTEAPRAPSRERRPHALVIGDDRARPFETEGLLCGAGCRVTSVVDASLGVQFILSDRPDLALLPATMARLVVPPARSAGSPTRLIGLRDDNGPATDGLDLAVCRPLDLQVLQQCLDAPAAGGDAATRRAQPVASAR